MPNVFSRSQDDEFSTQKLVKLNNNSAFSPVTPKPIQTQSTAFKLAFLLADMAKVAEAYAVELRKEELLNYQITNHLTYPNNVMNFLQSFKPIFPASDLRRVQFCNEFKQIDNNGPVDSSSTSTTDSPSASAEKMTEGSTVNLSDCASEPNQKGTKTVQSKFKNCYGLVSGRTIRSIKDYFRLMKQRKSDVLPENFRYRYIHDIICKLSDSEKARFEDYVTKYHKRSTEEKKNRGKSTIYKFLEQGGFNGLLLVNIIEEFLQMENDDFQSYINNETKPKKQVSHVLADVKNLAQLRDAFKEMECNLERKGFNIVKYEEL